MLKILHSTGSAAEGLGSSGRTESFLERSKRPVALSCRYEHGTTRSGHHGQGQGQSTVRQVQGGGLERVRLPVFVLCLWLGWGGSPGPAMQGVVSARERPSLVLLRGLGKLALCALSTLHSLCCATGGFCGGAAWCVFLALAGGVFLACVLVWCVRVVWCEGGSCVCPSEAPP